MSRPTVTTRTELAYDQLPQYVHDGDTDPVVDYATLRYLSLILDQMEKLRGILADPAAFVAPATAPYEVLPWLAQIYGIDTTLYPDTDGWRTALREAIGQASQTRTPGSVGATVAGIKPLLTGSKLVRVTGVNPDTVSYVVSTYQSQTPDAAAVVRAALSQKPAGVGLTVQNLQGQSFEDLKANSRTFDQVKASGLTFDQLKMVVPSE